MSFAPRAPGTEILRAAGNEARTPSRAAEAVQAGDSQSQASFVESLQRFEAQWQQGRREQAAAAERLPSEIRPLIEAQLAAAGLELRIHIISKCADAASAAVRRTQQAGG